MKSFLVAMLLYPDIQKKAQAELDSVIGRERLPTLGDRPNLPFIDATCKEVLRWRPVSPRSQMAPHVMYLMSLAAIPHAVTEDDVYAGFFIPKGGSCFLNKSAQCWPTYMFSGAMVLGNTWWVTFVTLSYIASMFFRMTLHDPPFYPDPDVFKPERFLNLDGSLRGDLVLVSAFGYGKRICPGRHFADATLFISVALFLSVFNIERGKDGVAKLSDYTFSGFIIR